VVGIREKLQYNVLRRDFLLVILGGVIFKKVFVGVDYRSNVYKSNMIY
jgi:hypothetical protein